MTIFFLLVCGLSVVFFLVFFWQCRKPRRAANSHRATSRPSVSVMADSMDGRRTLTDLEHQMEEFLTLRQRSA